MITSSLSFQHTQTDADIRQLIWFLITCVTFTADGRYFTVSGVLPLSYYSILAYWGDYICNVWAGRNGTDCTVVVKDHGGAGQPYYRNGEGSPGAQLQLERVDATVGTDIYDAACWQIALALAASKGLSDNGFQPTMLFSLVANTTKRLCPNVQAIRANTNNFLYGYCDSISDARLAYALRLVGNDFWAADPLWGNCRYGHYITFDSNIKDKIGSITWPDWKPITGENGWAFLIGPLQTDYLQSAAATGYIPFQSESIQNALYVLYAFQRMQCKIGAFYYAPGGSDGNTGPIPTGEISVENNVSCLSGLVIFKQVLETTLSKDNSLTDDDKAKIRSAINLISILIWGGKTPFGQTDGLLQFFQTKAWNAAEGIFYQGGTYNQGVWTPTTEPKAVDVDTWGLTVLGPATLDRWFGAGTAFTLWQNVKEWGSFSHNGQLWGVGYSDADNHSIMSAEWTAGAINAVRCLMVYYQSDGTKFASLQADHDAMMTNILNLRTDKYLAAGFPDGLEAPYFPYVNPPEGHLAFLYASKRYAIPFGWYANPIPSTTSTSWTIYLHYDYNPFQLGGAYTSIDWTTPTYDPTNDNGPWNSGILTLTVQNNITDAEIMPSYRQDATTPPVWTPLLTTSIPVNGKAVIQLPVSAYAFSVAYHKIGDPPANWYGACQLSQAQIGQLKNGQTITAVWTNAQGTGACQI